jgi:hypothetical protein
LVSTSARSPRRLAAGDRPLERGGAARALVGGLQRIRHVGPEPVGVVVGRIVRQAGLVRLEQRDRLVGALRLRQADRQIARRDALARPVVLGGGERPGFVGGEHRLGGAGGHQQGLRTGELRGEALRRRRGVIEQAVGEALRLLDALDEEQRLDRVDAGAERTFGVAALVAGRDDLAPVHQLVRAARGRERVARGGLVGGCSLGPALRGLPVHRDTRRRQPAPRQLLGDLRMQRARHRLRNAGARRVEDEVVGEAAVAHYLGALELAPWVGQVERVDAEHRRGELDVEVAVGDRREAREAQCRRREALQAGARSARRAAPASAAHAAPAPRRRAARRAASRAGTADCPPLWRQSGGAQASASMPGRPSDSISAPTPGAVERRQLDAAQRRAVERRQRRDRRRSPRRRPRRPAGCRAAIAGPAPPSAPAAFRGSRRRRSAGRRAPRSAGRRRRPRPATLQRPRAARADRSGSPASAPIPAAGARELVSGPRRQRLRRGSARSRRGEQRVRHRAVAGARRGARLAGLRRGEVAEEPALADAGFADHADDFAVLPGGLRGNPLRLATDQARRPQHGRCNARVGASGGGTLRSISAASSRSRGRGRRRARRRANRRRRS